MDFLNIDYLKQYFSEQFQNNDMLIGLFFTSLAGILLVSLKSVPYKIYSLIIRRFTCSYTIRSDDPVFSRFSEWLSTKEFFKINRDFKLVSLIKYDREENTNALHFLLTAGKGIFIFKYRNKYIKITSGDSEEGTNTNGDNDINNALASLLKKEFLKISYLGVDDGVIKSIMTEVSETFKEDKISKVSIKTRDHYNWKYAKELGKKGLDSVILRDTMKDDIVNDISTFLKEKEWYENMDIPYQRGYLFYGPPGTGKTSLAIAIASHFNKTIHCLNLSSRINDNQLKTLIDGLEPNSIVLMEDIDCAFNGRESSGGEDSLSFSALLNCMDGTYAKEGTIFIVTTNHIEKLDEALLRPGRLDVKYKLNKSDNYQVERLFSRFYKDHSLLKSFSDKIKDGEYSPAVYQSIFIKNRDPEKALEELDNIENYA